MISLKYSFMQLHLSNFSFFSHSRQNVENRKREEPLSHVLVPLVLYTMLYLPLRFLLAEEHSSPQDCLSQPILRPPHYTSCSVLDTCQLSQIFPVDRFQIPSKIQPISIVMEHPVLSNWEASWLLSNRNRRKNLTPTKIRIMRVQIMGLFPNPSAFNSGFGSTENFTDFPMAPTSAPG